MLLFRVSGWGRIVNIFSFLVGEERSWIFNFAFSKGGKIIHYTYLFISFLHLCLGGYIKLFNRIEFVPNIFNMTDLITAFCFIYIL